MIQLRPYQEQAVQKLMWSQQLVGNDICVLPTGAGKSIVISELAHRIQKPILILQPTKEILEQNLAKLSHYVDPWDIGIYSASMGQKEIGKFTFATIQSIYKKPEYFKHFNVVVIDECHSVNVKNLSGMFTTFLKSIEAQKVIGFTATPYRQAQAYVPDNDGSGWGGWKTVTTTKLINRVRPQFWSRIIFNINNEDLVNQGYLTRLKYVDMSLVNHEDIPLNKSCSDFDLTAFEASLLGQESKIREALVYAEKTSKSILVFCSSVEQAQELSEATLGSEFVSGKTPKKKRERIIEGFKNGTIKTVFNVGVLTTGFDHPELDCIVLIRPTRSIALYYQMLGRGVRTAPGKESCQVIDLTSTCREIGEIESIKLERTQQGWQLFSSKGQWHGKVLYEYKIEKGVQNDSKKSQKIYEY